MTMSLNMTFFFILKSSLVTLGFDLVWSDWGKNGRKIRGGENGKGGIGIVDP